MSTTFLSSEFTTGDVFQEIANRISKHTPEGYVIRVCIEDGAAWAELYSVECCGTIELPDAGDKSLLSQVNDALCVANGWEV